MDPKITQRYSPAILHEAVQRFGIDEQKIELLDGFESFIYSFSRPEGEFILRIGHSLRRSQELILGEVDWINYLAAGGAGVAKAVLSNEAKLVEFIPDGQGGFFMATAFEKAGGGPAGGEMWNPTLFQAWGRNLGRIHALSKDYMPSRPAWKRGEWDSPVNLQVENWLPASDTAILGKFQELMAYLQMLPKDREGYGLIHQDAHAGNFFVDQDYKITLFDFDDCVYSWFVYDIAMVLFYGLMAHEGDPDYVRSFTRPFLEGYHQENKLDPVWLAEIPHFLKLREIDLYAQILFSFGGPDQIDDPWCQNYMKGRKEKIESGSPYIDFNWDSLAAALRP
ncbi:MAG: phosphotransferase [Anaerolineales bacterium]|nr:phosphotransferase [Anaerolineales bacterium]